MTKKEALAHLNERRNFFLDKQLFGRAETMKELYELIEKKDDSENFDSIRTVGLYIERFEII